MENRVFTVYMDPDLAKVLGVGLDQVDIRTANRRVGDAPGFPELSVLGDERYVEYGPEGPGAIDKKMRHPEIEPGWTRIKGRDGKRIPRVMLSDLSHYRQNPDAELPREMTGIEGEEGVSRSWDPNRMINSDQVIRAILEMLHMGILHNWEFSSIEKRWLEIYKNRLSQMLPAGAKDSLYGDVDMLTNACVKLHTIYYESWIGKGAKGSKKAGANEMTAAFSTQKNSELRMFAHDPIIAYQRAHIRGRVNPHSFVSGEVRGADGDIWGGDAGACEKVAYMLGTLYADHVNHDPTGVTASEAYTYHTIYQAHGYFASKEASYPNWRYVVMGDPEEVHTSEDGLTQINCLHDARLHPTAMHHKSLNAWMADPENFTETNFGYSNIGRMLSLLDDPNRNRDRARTDLFRKRNDVTSRYTQNDFLMATAGSGGSRAEERLRNAEQAHRVYARLTQHRIYRQDDFVREARNLGLPENSGNEAYILYQRLREGVYSLQEFLFADDQTKHRMSEAAFIIYSNLDTDQRRTILLVNSYRRYLLGKKSQITDRHFTYQIKSVLDYGETDGKGNDFVDWGNFNHRYWPEAELGNAHATDLGYAFDFLDGVLNELCQSNQVAFGNLIKVLNLARTAKEGLRHLDETADQGTPFRALAFEKTREVDRHWRRLTRMIIAQIWSDRSKGRIGTKKQELELAVMMNRYVNNGFLGEVFRAEYESVGVFNRGYETLRPGENPLTPQEVLAKLIGKGLERPDLLICFLDDIGLVKHIGEITEGRAPNNWKDSEEQRTWAALGIINYQEYLAYMATISFAGFEIIGAGQEYDCFGNLVPRVKLKLDSEYTKNLDRREARGFYGTQFLRVHNDKERAREVYGQVVQFFLGDSGRGDQLRSRLDVMAKRGVFTDNFVNSLFGFSYYQDEGIVIDGIIESYLQKHFDRNPNNWVRNRWGRRLNHYQRLQTHYLIRRQMKYSCGRLMEQGYYVHDQPNVIGTRRLLNGQIVPVIEVDKRGMPVMRWSAGINNETVVTDPGSNYVGWNVADTIGLGTGGVVRPPEVFMSPMISTPEERHEYAMEKSWRSRTGLGDAGDIKRLSPLEWGYNKVIQARKAFAYLFDPAFSIERAVNAGYDFELDRQYAKLYDLEQQADFFLALASKEDPEWVRYLKEGIHFPEHMVEEFEGVKRKYRIADTKGRQATSVAEKERAQFQQDIRRELKLPWYVPFPVIRNYEELKSFAIPALPTAIGLTRIAASLGVFQGGLIVMIPAGLAIFFGASFVGRIFTDYGLNEDGREAAEGLSRILGGPIGPVKIPRWVPFLGNKSIPLPKTALGMYGKRILLRTPDTLLNGYMPVYDSANNVDQDVSFFIEVPKDNLAPNKINAG